MPSEISFPFRLGPDNKIAVETDPNVQIRQHVNSLVNTNSGERVVLGAYGVPLNDSLFESNEAVVASDLASDIADSLAIFEPGVVVQQVQPVPSTAGDGIAIVNVRYLRTDAPTSNISTSNSQNIAVISATGQVSEVIRG